jgi:hypothetical protein
VEVRDGLAAVRAVVDYHAEAVFRAAEVGGNLSGGEKKVAEDGLVFGRCLADACDDLVRDDENVNRRLRGNIAEGEAYVIAVDYIGGDLAVADFLKNRLHCGCNLAGGGLSGKCEKLRYRAIPAHQPCTGCAPWTSQGSCRFPRKEDPERGLGKPTCCAGC